MHKLIQNIVRNLPIVLIWAFTFVSHFGLAINAPMPNDSSDESPTNKPALQLVTGSNYFPYISDKAPDGGWSQALIEAVFKHMGERVQIDILPWARGMQWTLDGRYVGTYPYVHSAKREAKFYYSDPINWVPVKMYVSAESEYTKLSQLSKKNLCLPHGYTLDSWSTQFFEQYEFRISRAKDANACAGQIMKKWSDVGLINGYFTSSELMSRFGSLDNLRLLDDEIGKVPLHFIVPKSLPNAASIVQQFNLSLHAISQSGEKQMIDQRFITWLKQQDEETDALNATTSSQSNATKNEKRAH
ncbi:MAG: hypothetical protein Alis3KO_36450 [Aliiglaciecola sp.]